AARIGRIMTDGELVSKAEKLAVAAAQRIEKAYDAERKVYAQSLHSPNLDASTLKLITMNYLDPKSQRARDHLIALEEKLKTKQGLFYRYVHPDDFGTPQATFLVCAFWYIDA